MRIDLGPVTVLGAEAISQPNQHQFCLFAQSARGSALMWVGKEQLDGLSIAPDRSLALITEGQVLHTEAQIGGRPIQKGLPANFLRSLDYECQADDAICPFCHKPLEGKSHTCIRQNGHREFIYSLRDKNEEE